MYKLIHILILIGKYLVLQRNPVIYLLRLKRKSPCMYFILLFYKFNGSFLGGKKVAAGLTLDDSEFFSDSSRKLTESDSSD